MLPADIRAPLAEIEDRADRLLARLRELDTTDQSDARLVGAAMARLEAIKQAVDLARYDLGRTLRALWRR